MMGGARPSRGHGLSSIPSVDRLLNEPEVIDACGEFGRAIVSRAVREVADEARQDIVSGLRLSADAGSLAHEAASRAERWMCPAPRRVFNLTGTVLHTNLGRSPLPREALDAIELASGASNVEFDLEVGKRGERDTDVENWLRRLTDAEAAVVVNNNAAAVLLVLNTLAMRKEVLVSRGELVEIGGSFRMPDIMKRAGCRLREVGTTNRTHVQDYEDAISERTGLLMKVRTSNYEIRGFTAAVSDPALAGIGQRHGVPSFVDLGSGALVDLVPLGLPWEPTPQSILGAGIDVVSFSGDKLLGGPQVGIIAGRQALLRRIRRNPLLRALRVDKLRLAALSAVLRLYADPERLTERLPTLRLLTRPVADIEAVARRVQLVLADLFAGQAEVRVVPCESQVGSGAHPLECLPSVGLTIAPQNTRKPGYVAIVLARKFRTLPIPVIGRIERDALLFDLRCLESADVDGFVRQLDERESLEENRSRWAAWTSNPLGGAQRSR